jgi:hypothetical protein
MRRISLVVFLLFSFLSLLVLCEIRHFSLKQATTASYILLSTVVFTSHLIQSNPYGRSRNVKRFMLFRVRGSVTNNYGFWIG